MTKKFAPPAPRMIPARWHGGSQTPKAIVMHGTVSPTVNGGEEDIAHFFATEANKTSAHYVVSPSGEVQCVGDHTIAYHCGYNTGSIGVELCDPETGSRSRWSNRPHKAMLARAATLVAQLCLAYDIEVRRPSVEELKAKGPHGIYGHNDSRLAFGNTTHSDPIGFPWKTFIKQVQAEVDRLKAVAEPAAKKPAKKTAKKPPAKKPAPTPTPAPAPTAPAASRAAVMHAPLHGPTASHGDIRHIARLARAAAVTSIGFTEAYHVIPFLLMVLGYRLIISPVRGRLGRRGWAKDNPILLRRRDVKLLEKRTVKASDSLGTKVAPARGVTAVVYRIKSTGQVVLHMALHPNAAVEGQPAHLPRVKGYAAVQGVAEELHAELVAKWTPDLVAITQDGQWKSTAKTGQPAYAPQEVAARLGLGNVYHVPPLDWLSANQRATVQVFAEDVTHQDHDWYIATFPTPGA